MDRRAYLRLLLLAGLTAVASANAANYPGKMVRIVVFIDSGRCPRHHCQAGGSTTHGRLEAAGDCRK